MGITRIADVTGLDSIGIPVVMVVRPNSRSLSVSQGKGVDLDSATASGLMESIELHTAERLDLSPRMASAATLRRERQAMLDVESLARPTWTRWHPDLEIRWVSGTNLLTGRTMWVPYEGVHVDGVTPHDAHTGVVAVTSNGLASGNHLAEAIVHGLCEVVERDAMALLSARPPAERAARRIDPATVDDDECRRLLDLYDEAGVEVGIWDATSDVGIACLAVAITERDPSPFRRIPLARGAGCHPSAPIALSRALTEAAQCRLTVIAGSRDDHLPSSYQQLRDPARVAAMGPMPARPTSFADVPSVSAATVIHDLDHVVARVRAVGVRQIAVVDLSPAELPVSVVRVLVPGLEGMSDVVGYVPGSRARHVGGAR
jgi:ribosomal protein S12 methylthiotransferase accessory factor